MRKAFTLLELLVALAVFALTLSGLYPLVLMHSRQLKRLEQRLNPQTVYYLVPPQDPWAQKLGAGARLLTADPGPLPPPPVLVLDSSGDAYSEVGTGWAEKPESAAYHGSCRWHPNGDGSSTASWQFTNLAPGWYDVRITWPARMNHATNAPFTVLDGTTNRGTFPINQTVAPSGAVEESVPWQTLAVVSVISGTAKVVLTDLADGHVVADGIRLVPVRNTVRVDNLTRSMTSEEISTRTTLTVVTP